MERKRTGAGQWETLALVFIPRGSRVKALGLDAETVVSRAPLLPPLRPCGPGPGGNAFHLWTATQGNGSGHEMLAFEAVRPRGRLGGTGRSLGEAARRP
jgi:hypothetical protein